MPACEPRSTSQHGIRLAQSGPHTDVNLPSSHVRAIGTPRLWAMLLSAQGSLFGPMYAKAVCMWFLHSHSGAAHLHARPNA